MPVVHRSTPPQNGHIDVQEIAPNLLPALADLGVEQRNAGPLRLNWPVVTAVWQEMHPLDQLMTCFTFKNRQRGLGFEYPPFERLLRNTLPVSGSD